MPHRGATSRSSGGSRADPYGVPAGRHRRGWRRSAVRRDARGGGDGRRRLAPGDGGDPARRRRARLPPGRRAPPRDARPGVRVLHLRRPGPRDRPGATRRPARPVRRPRRPSRRRRPGDPLGRPGRADAVVPRDRAGTCSRGRAGSTSSGEGDGGRDRRSTCRSSRGRARARGSRRFATLLPEVAAAFGPDIVVSQHGADSHAWDPLAHLRVTTTAMGEAARLVDAVAHRYAGGRWLATGGGGYDAYRVVPRTWSLVWLAGAHREVPDATPAAWRERWASEAARYGQAPLPERVRGPAERRRACRRGGRRRPRRIGRRRRALVRRLGRAPLGPRGATIAAGGIRSLRPAAAPPPTRAGGTVRPTVDPRSSRGRRSTWDG